MAAVLNWIHNFRWASNIMLQEAVYNVVFPSFPDENLVKLMSKFMITIKGVRNYKSNLFVYNVVFPTHVDPTKSN